MKVLKKVLLAIVLVIVFAIALIVILATMGNNDKTESSAPATSAETTKETEKPAETVLLDDDAVKVTFLDLYDIASISGCSYLKMRVENKTDVRVWVHLDEVDINGYSVMASSAVPMEINAGGKSVNPFIFFHNQFEAESVDDIEEIRFIVVIEDADTFKTLHKSDVIEIKP